MGKIYTSIGELMLEFLTELPATKKFRSKTVCNNTVVKAIPATEGTRYPNEAVCELHGHRIAKLYNWKGKLYIEISLCGFNTHTTRNRLDGVLLGLDARISVYQKNIPCISTDALGKPMQINSHDTYAFELRTGKPVETLFHRVHRLNIAEHKRKEKSSQQA